MQDNIVEPGEWNKRPDTIRCCEEGPKNPDRLSATDCISDCDGAPEEKQEEINDFAESD
jgi:hypothetical protein